MKFALLLLTAAAVFTTTTAIKCYVCKEGLEPDECKHTTGQQTDCPANVNTCYVREISKNAFTRCHILFMNGFTAFPCIFEELPLHNTTTESSSKTHCNVENACSNCGQQLLEPETE